MSKFVKSSLIVAGVFAALGVVFCLVSAILGGKSLIYYARNVEGKSRYVEDVLEDFVYRIDGWHISWRDRNPEELTVNDHMETTAEQVEHQPIEGIKNLNLMLGAGSFVIREKDTDDGMIDIYIQGKGGCDYAKKGDTLYVEGFKGIKTIETDLSENVITLVIPAGTSMEEVDIEVGAGVMEIVSLKAKEIDALIGAGELRIDQAQAQDLSAEIGVGRFEANNMDVEEASLTLSLGECIYEGAISGNLDIECDMGNMEISLSGHEDDYNYEIECGAGNIEIGGVSYAALASERHINNGCHRDIEIECNMGNIEIQFKE
ncbi:MAG: DUF4097 family beta strand repeat protein [Lachnospiraceae bacterium]|nr:DUF4097 family beta strand repeat protein [Lachnospiraceae bacterium]